DQRLAEVVDERVSMQTIGVADHLGGFARQRAAKYTRAHHGRIGDVRPKEIGTPPDCDPDLAGVVRVQQRLRNAGANTAFLRRGALRKVFGHVPIYLTISVEIVGVDKLGPGGCCALHNPCCNARKLAPARIGQADTVIYHGRSFAGFAALGGIAGIDAADLSLQVFGEPDAAGAIYHAHGLAVPAQFAHDRQPERAGAEDDMQCVHNARIATRLSSSRAAPSGLRSARPNCGAWISKTSPTLVSIFLVKLPVAAPKKCTCTSPGWRKSRYLK